MKPPQLLDTYLAHSAILLFPSVPSSILVTAVSRHIKGLEETQWDSLGRLFRLPTFHFVANLYSRLLQLLDLLCQMCLWQRERDGDCDESLGTHHLLHFIAHIFYLCCFFLSLAYVPFITRPFDSLLSANKQQLPDIWCGKYIFCQPNNSLIMVNSCNQPWKDMNLPFLNWA